MTNSSGESGRGSGDVAGDRAPETALRGHGGGQSSANGALGTRPGTELLKRSYDDTARDRARKRRFGDTTGDRAPETELQEHDRG
jgi:hypothetical protein